MTDPNPKSPLLPVFLKLNCSDLSSRGSRTHANKMPLPSTTEPPINSVLF